MDYRFKTDEYNFMGLPEGNQIGFLAQDVEMIFPDLVKETRHPGPSETSVEKGIYQPHAPVDFLSVNYIGLIPHLTRAIQEQQLMIENRDEEIINLRKSLTDMQSAMDQVLIRINELESKVIRD